VLIATILGGPYFCGWLCPFGTIQEILYKLGRILKLPKIKINKKIHRYTILFRYFSLLTITIGLFYLLKIDARVHFLDVLRGDSLSISIYSILAFFIVISLFFDRFFCNYFCIQGARYGLYSAIRIFRIKRDEKKCINCKICDKNCPMNIEISTKKYVNSLQCINCFKCTSNCPKKNTLKYKLIEFKKINEIIKNPKTPTRAHNRQELADKMNAAKRGKGK
jgi:polyferredoxin